MTVIFASVGIRQVLHISIVVQMLKSISGTALNPVTSFTEEKS